MDAADTADGVPDATAELWRDDLLSTLEVIEDQPLAERASAYASLHDELARRLDSGPSGSA
ncbi:hypothetical protein F6B42_10345 [Microbacterium radiodurans]|uniref:Uncharacterized protein n=2 Tax=Microbacterium radiodurans TaxID=661398 RepID=A0A5J5IPY5_9MICO|nr:hypothetical protein F6B42_10345 [Microbacterium radiodurans]